MARAITWFVRNQTVNGFAEMRDGGSPGADATASPQTGWVVGTGATNHSEFFTATNRASTTFTGTTVPDGSIDTTNKDCWRSDKPMSGDFASANWNIHFACIGVTQSGAQDGRIRIRLFKAAADGTSATEITAAQQQGGLVTNLAGTQQTSTVTFNPGAFSVADQYIFIQLAWERTGAGGMSTTDVAMRIGNTASRVISSSFTLAAIAVSDSASVTDSIARTEELARSPSDTASVTDATARTMSMAREAADTSSVTDDVVRDLTQGGNPHLMERTVEDSVSVTDSTARTESFLRATNDTVSVTDSIARTVAFARSSLDTAGITDAVARTETLARSAADTAGVTDAGERTLTLGRSPSDTVAVTDSLVRAPALWTRSTADTASIADAVTADLISSGLIQRNIGDTVDVTDSVARTESLTRTAADAVAATDSIARTASLARAIADSIAAADALARTVFFTRELLDTASGTDAATGGLVVLGGATHERPIFDSIVMTDGVDAVLFRFLSEDTKAITVSPVAMIAETLNPYVTIED